MSSGSAAGERLRAMFATASQSLLGAALALTLAACASAPHSEPVDRARYLMGTACQISLAGSAADADAAFDEIARIENFLSTWKSESELSSLNRAPVGTPVRLSPELFELLHRTFTIARTTDGAFNPMLRPLIDLWKTREEGTIPSAASISAALQRTSIDLLSFDRVALTVTRLADVRVEEGGFGKGYAIDRAIALLRERGVASGYIDFGGQVSAFGTAAVVAVADPVERDKGALAVTLHEASISTSAGSEKGFVIDGRAFTHILDPRTGEALPPRGSVSVIHPSALDADVLSTALYVMGPDQGFRYANEHGIDAVFIVPSSSDPGRFDVRVSNRLGANGTIQVLSEKFSLKD